MEVYEQLFHIVVYMQLIKERVNQYKVDEFKYPSKKTIDRLTKELGLKGADKYTQDWEYEVVNVNQLPNYINFYKNNKLNLNEKSTLMRIILEAYNDYVSLGNYDETYKNLIKEFLERDYTIHKDTITYWLCEDCDLDDYFAITPFMREIKNN